MGRVTVKLGLTDLTPRLWHKKTTFDFTENGNTADIFMLFDDGGTEPTVGSRLTVTLPDGNDYVFVVKFIPETQEVYGDPSVPIWVKKFICVDPLSYLATSCLPNIFPFVSTNTGTLLSTVIHLLDPTLILSFASGNDVPGLNLQDFSTLQDLIKSEITSGGYIVRMGTGLNVQGGFEGSFGTYSVPIDPAFVGTYQYTPSNITVTTPEEPITSATVTTNEQIPLYGVSVYDEVDARVEAALNFPGAVLDASKSNVLSLTTGIDLEDINTYAVSGAVDVSGSHIEPNGGRVVVLEARPFVFPYSSSITGIVGLAGGASYQVGFTDSGGSFILSSTEADFGGLSVDSTLDQHSYEVYFAPVAGTKTVNIWGTHIHQDFTVSVTDVVANIVSVNTGAKTITLDAPWNIGNNYIRITSGGIEINRETILLMDQNNTVLTLDDVTGITAGMQVERGVGGDVTLSIFQIGSVTTGGDGYGLPTITGNNVAIEKFSTQHVGQISGVLLSESQAPSGVTLPRDMQIDTVVTEKTDALLGISGSSTVVTLAQSFTHDPRIELLFNYIAGGKRNFNSGSCGAGGHINLNVQNEQDPIVLQALADRIVTLGSRGFPKIDWKLPSVFGEVPLPFTNVTVNLPSEYHITNGPYPIISSKLTYKGADNTDDIFEYDIQIGYKPVAQRVQEQLLRGVGNSKYPLTFATIPIAKLTSVNWNSDTGVLSYSVSGASSVSDLRGNAIGGSFRPAEVAGVANPALNPVVVRLVATPTRSPVLHNDYLIFKCVYPPNAVDASTSTAKLFYREKQIEYTWGTADGADKYDIYQQISATGGDGDGNLIQVDSVPAPDTSWRGPIEQSFLAIYVQSVGLCDKKSAKVKLNKTLIPFVVNPWTVVKPTNRRGRTIMLVGAAATSGATSGDIAGDAIFLRIFARPATAGSSGYAGRSDFPSNNDDVFIQDFPIVNQGQAGRYAFHYDHFNAITQDLWATACWVDQFNNEGPIAPILNVSHPLMTVGYIATGDFFQSNLQVNGGTVEDDSDTTTLIEHTGVFRVHLGKGNAWVKLEIERSTKTSDGSIGVFNDNTTVQKQKYIVNDADTATGYVDIPFKQDFVWARKKQRTYRPSLIQFGGIAPRERIDASGNIQEIDAVMYLEGYSSSASIPPIVTFQTDAIFDKTKFQFQPGIPGLTHNYLDVTNVSLRAKKALLKLKFDAIDDSALRRYIVFISTANFGTKGPGSDATLASDLDAVMSAGGGTITLYDPTNSTRSVSCAAIDVGTSTINQLLTGDTYGGITITSGTTYYIGIIAQNKPGRYSVDISSPLSATASEFPSASGFSSTFATDTIVGPSGGTSISGLIAVSGTKLYALRCNKSSSNNVDDLYIYNVSTPTAPSLLNSGGTNIVNDTQANININSNTGGIVLANQLMVTNGTTLFIGLVPGGATKPAIRIVNVSTPSAPTVITDILSSTLGTPTSVSALQLIGNTLYVLVDPILKSASLYIIDVTTPSSPTVTGSLVLGGFTGTPTGFLVSGANVYVLQNNGTTTLGVINITTPATPTLTSTFGAGSNGTIDKTPVLIGSDLITGVDVFDISNLSAPALIGNSNFFVTGSRGGQLQLNGNTVIGLDKTTLVNIEFTNFTSVISPTLTGTITQVLSNLAENFIFLADTSNAYFSYDLSSQFDFRIFTYTLS
jgi:hypothetical protein